MEMEKLLTRDEVENYPVGTKFIEVNKHKIGGYIEEIKVTLGMGAEWLGKLLYGIWVDWNDDDWDLLGYKLVKVGDGK